MITAAIPIIEMALGGLGTMGNLFGGKQQAKAASNLQNAQANMENFMQGQAQGIANMTPGQIMQQQQQYLSPLNANMQNYIAQMVGPQLASMGLGQSPGQLAGGMATSLAPYMQHNQDLAQQMEQWKLLAPAQYAGPALEATQNLPQYFQQNQGAGSQLIAGLQGLSDYMKNRGTGGYTPTPSADPGFQT